MLVSTFLATSARARADQSPAQAQLSMDDRWLLDRGFISEGEHVGGGIVALIPGFGLGHAIQDRWLDRGWMFTVGEGVTLATAIVGLAKLDGVPAGDPSGDRYVVMMFGGLVGFFAVRIWGALDAFLVPPAHNRRVLAVRTRLGMPTPAFTLAPYIAPSRDRDGGGVAGVSLRF